MSTLAVGTHKPRVGRRAAAVRLATFLLGLALVAIALHFAGLAINVTDSMPIGIYHVERNDRAPVKGDIVQMCAPPAIAAIAKARGYLMRGSCAFATAQMVKIVAAVAGDTVDVSDDAVVVDGYRLPGSATQRRDGHGRPLAHVARGRYVLRPGEMWLWTPNPRSWDSRYYGPQHVAEIGGYAALVMPFWDWPYARTHVTRVGS